MRIRFFSAASTICHNRVVQYSTMAAMTLAVLSILSEINDKVALYDPYSNDHLPTITLAVSVCSHSEMPSALRMLKSAIFFSKGVRLHILGLTTTRNEILLIEKIDEILNTSRLYDSVSYDVVPFWTPKFYDMKKEELQSLEGKDLCKVQYLFYHLSLNGFETILHVEPSIVFLSDLNNYIKLFSKMSPKQTFAVAESPNHLYFNGGVMLFNLTRIRESGFYMRNKEAIKTLFLNSILPPPEVNLFKSIRDVSLEYRYEFPCGYNYQPELCDNCSASSGCCNVSGTGIHALNAGIRTRLTERVSNVFETDDRIQLRVDLWELQREGLNFSDVVCSSSGDLFKNVEKFIKY